MSILRDIFHARKNRRRVSELGKQVTNLKKQIQSLDEKRLKKEKRDAAESVISYQAFLRKTGTAQTVELLFAHAASAASTAMDIGCNEGVISLALSRAGLSVLGVEANSKTEPARVARMKETSSLLFVTSKVTLENIQTLPEVDLITLLSVHHQFVFHYGEVAANQLLLEISRKAKLQFFFMPACICAKYGPGFDRIVDNDQESIDKYVKDLFKSEAVSVQFLGMVENNLPPEEPLRPLYLISKTQGIGTPRLRRNSDILNGPAEIGDVDVDLMRFGPGVSLQRDGWNYFREAVQEIINTGDLSRATGHLDRYYRSHQPANLGQLFYPFDQSAAEGLAQFPCRPAIPMPWANHPAPPYWFSFVPKDLDFDYQWHRCGPMEHENVTRHVTSLAETCESISQHGYLPDLFPDGYIRGYFLRNLAGEFRFVVSGGQHRAAILAELGHKSIRVQLQPGHLRIVDEATLGQTPGVRTGVYTIQQARLLFDGLFNQNGSELRNYVERSCRES